MHAILNIPLYAHVRTIEMLSFGQQIRSKSLPEMVTKSALANRPVSDYDPYSISALVQTSACDQDGEELIVYRTQQRPTTTMVVVGIEIGANQIIVCS